MRNPWWRKDEDAKIVALIPPPHRPRIVWGVLRNPITPKLAAVNAFLRRDGDNAVLARVLRYLLNPFVRYCNHVWDEDDGDTCIVCHRHRRWWDYDSDFELGYANREEEGRRPLAAEEDDDPVDVITAAVGRVHVRRPKRGKRSKESRKLRNMKAKLKRKKKLAARRVPLPLPDA